MITEQLIRQNLVRHNELLRESAQSRAGYEALNGPSLVSKALARTGELLVVAGLGLQRRYRRMEQGASMADYAQSQRLGRAL